MEGVWREIARKLNASAFNGPVVSTADKAVMLGSCAIFGGIPDSGLEALVESNETPLLVLRSGEGAVWRALREFAQSKEFIEAPFELGYTTKQKLGGFGSDSGLQGWEGDDALFPSEGFSSERYPWLSSVLEFGHEALMNLGWRPVEIRLAHPPASETVPLVCLVWRNVGPYPHAKDLTEQPHRGQPEKLESSMIFRSLYRESPELLRFPANVAKYAAIGSRYWNIDHPKIAKIVAVLNELADRERQQSLSADSAREIHYLTSNRYYGHLVPSRKSGDTLALEVPNRLLDVAEKEGLPHAGRLLPSDFLPGTVEMYENPYHYELTGWKIRGTGLGRIRGAAP